MDYSRPDWVITGGPLPDGRVQLIASTDLRVASLDHRQERLWDGANPNNLFEGFERGGTEPSPRWSASARSPSIDAGLCAQAATTRRATDSTSTTPDESVLRDVAMEIHHTGRFVVGTPDVLWPHTGHICPEASSKHAIEARHD